MAKLIACMRRLFFLLVTIFITQMLFAQANAKKDEETIRATRAASNKAIAAHNLDGLVISMAPDFTITLGRAVTITGRDAVQASWKELFATNTQVNYQRIPSQVTISKNDTLAWETGTWKAEHSYSAGGNYSAMWCKRNGVWLIRAELFVSMEK